MECLNLDDSIKKAKNILIISHINPDGDTLGSMCALSSIIYENYKKKPEMMVLSKVPRLYDFLPNIEKVKHISNFDKSMVYDMVILVDIAALDRIGDAQIFYEKAKIKVSIDHHKTNNYNADLSFVDGNISSTGEMIYKIAKELCWKIDENIAKSIYIAILTDTGGFRFDNTSAVALKIASALVELGVKPIDMYKKCYETKMKEQVIFQAECINKAIFTENDKIAYIVIYKKDLEKYNNSEDYTEGLVETLRAIDTTEVAFLMKELDNKVFKISMRSKQLDISKVCSTFNGGGHEFASGCTLKMSAADGIKKLITEIKKQGL